MRQFAAVALLLVTGGCKQHGLVNAGPDMAPMLAFAPHDKVDILFMIDNSPGLPAAKAELRTRFPQLIKALDDAAAQGHAASYHIGVVTSDLGAGPYVLNNGQCHPDGDGGKLQVLPAGGASSVPANCASFSLSGGVRYLDYDQIAGTTNIVGGLSVPDSFNCMAEVGGAGCGFEHQLESVYRALHDPPAENAGFLRDDALLVVLLLTDEDDCSAPPDTDLFDPSADGVAKYGVLHSFRCTQFGIACGEPPIALADNVAPRTDCRPLAQADGGHLFDIQRYIDLFTKPGVKPDPSDIVVASIAGPLDPFGVTLTMPCADQVKTASCPILNNSCVATGRPQSANPGIRIAAVVGAAYTSQQTSVCDSGYGDAINGVAQKIVARLK